MDFYTATGICGTCSRHPSLEEAKGAALARSKINTKRKFMVSIRTRYGEAIICYALDGTLYNKTGLIYKGG